MNTASISSPSEMHGPRDNYRYKSNSSYGRPGPFKRAENWLDEKGKGAWIASMVLGFVFFWPVGLALLFYMIWSKNMFSKSRNCGSHSKHNRSFHRGAMAMKSSGNFAFDAYKEDTLRRLEDEQRNFEEFLERLREAKDKSEFDQFMDDRANMGPEEILEDEEDDGFEEINEDDLSDAAPEPKRKKRKK